MKNTKKATKILFVIYLLLIVWIILMKTEFSFDNIYRMQSLNLIPLEGTAVRNNRLDYQEIYLNIFIFLPFGLYMSILKENWSFFSKLFPIFLVSFLFESFQFYFSIGASDITDLIANTVGGAIGIGLYLILEKINNNQKKLNDRLNLLALGVTILFLFFIFFVKFI